MGLEKVLAQIEGDGRRFDRDEELYYLSIFGDPCDEEKVWFWRFEGHHISLNNTIVAGRLVSATPVFLGANPAQVRHGEMEGLRALKEEEEMAEQVMGILVEGPEKMVEVEEEEEMEKRIAALVRQEVQE